MTRIEPGSIPIILNDKQSSTEGIKGKVEVTYPAVKILNGNPEILARSVPKAFVLYETKEHVIFHELIHLLLQDNFLSKNYLEGHAHALASKFYGIEHVDAASLLKHPSLNKALNFGSDFNNIDEAFQGGTHDQNLRLMIHEKWEAAWTEFFEKHPDYPRKFYAEVTRLSKAGKISFSKQDLDGISAGIASDFNGWNQKNLSMREMGESGSEKVAKAIRAGQNDLIIINVQSFPRNRSNDVNTLQPPVLRPYLPGLIQIFISNPKNPGQNATLNIPSNLGQEYVDVNLTADLITAKIEKVTIGGIEIPVE